MISSHETVLRNAGLHDVADAIIDLERVAAAEDLDLNWFMLGPDENEPMFVESFGEADEMSDFLAAFLWWAIERGAPPRSLAKVLIGAMVAY